MSFASNAAKNAMQIKPMAGTHLSFAKTKTRN